MLYASGEGFTLYQGDNRVVLKELADNSVDSVVTDPPYELGFMGKSWDASGIAYDVELWREVLRVLKPGGHLLAFSGSRTYHRMAVAIEDAGFEIRDQIMWIYGSGFPKSLDVSKAIDKRGGSIPWQAGFATHLREIRPKNLSVGEINQHISDGKSKSNFWGHFIDVKSQPLLPTLEQYVRLKQILPIDDMWDSQFLPEAEREVVGSKTSGIGTAFGDGEWASGQAQEVDITAPATDEARQWQGWGTALKPAHEPVVLARKPLIGTVAANVLTYGTGGLNIDGGRVSSADNFDGLVGRPIQKLATRREGETDEQYRERVLESPAQQAALEKLKELGRWPANVIHDGSDEVVELFPNSKGGAFPAKRGQAVNTSFASGQETEGGFRAMGDDGSAARFFYCAKASKKDRNEGLDGFEAIRIHDGRTEGTVGGSNPRNRTNNYRQNHHPTVKPTTLMEYLCKLVTPPNGIVLDPFMGSGSTGKAAMYAGFNFIGIEMTEEYLPIAKARIEFAANNREETLFDA